MTSILKVDQVEAASGTTLKLQEQTIQIQDTSSNNMISASQGGAVVLAHSTSAKLSTTSDGIDINGGNITFDTASKGIHLGVTTPTAANLLDDYEEGTWTPVWQGLSGSAGSSSTSASAAVYTKIGRIVNFSCQARWSNQGSYSGLAVLTGLPFTSSSSNSSGCAFGFIELVDFKGGTLISAQVAGSQSYITWREINDDGSPTGLDISAFDNGGNDMVITGQYIV